MDKGDEMSKDIYITLCTKEQGKLEFTEKEWYDSPYFTPHRLDGPAKEWSDGGKAWYVDGKFHREDGPAVEFSGRKEWFINGKRHRANGPAVEHIYFKEWHVNNKLHRIDGPARELPDGRKEWFVDGEKYSEEDFDQTIQEAKALPLELRLIDPRWWVREMK
jgi:hypothetical protein